MSANMNNRTPEDVKAAIELTRAEGSLPPPDDQSKSEVAAAVETIATEAQKANPTEFLVKAAGNALVVAGQKVQEFAEPISKAVNTVLGLLKIAI
jgi:hypothetical protein